MTVRRGVAASVFVVLAVLSAGCGGAGDARTTGATVPRLATTTTAPTIPLKPVPELADVTYAQRVVDELDAAMGRAATVFMRDKKPSLEAYAALERSVGLALLDHYKSLFGQSAARGMADIRATPRPPVTRIESLPDVSHRCFVVLAHRDLSPIWPARRDEPVYLKFLPEITDETAVPWRITEEVAATGPIRSDPCLS